MIAVIAGVTFAWLGGPAVQSFLPHDFTGKLALGLLATGGPRSWNSILAYVTKAKDVKAAEAETRQIEARRKESDSAEARPLAQTHRLADAFHDLLRDFIRASRAFFENVVDVQFVG